MGAKPSSQRLHLPNSDAAVRSSLNDHEAWAIATSESERLGGFVQLVCDRDGPVSSIVKSHAWVFFPEALASDEDAASVRAASLAWSALASYRGYGAKENPVFWRRVFSKLSERQRGDFLTIETSSPSDSIRFFDQRPFPSIRVCVHEASNSRLEHAFSRLEILFSLNRSRDDGEASVRLAASAESMRTVAEIDVCLDIVLSPQKTPISALLPHLRQLVSCINSQPHDEATPRFHISRINFRGTLLVTCGADVQAFSEFFQKPVCRTGDFHVAVSAGVPLASLGGFIRALTGALLGSV